MRAVTAQDFRPASRASSRTRRRQPTSHPTWRRCRPARTSNRNRPYYLADIYQPDPDGQDLANSPVSTQWNTWLGCVTAANSARPDSPAALGIAEYGLGTLAGDRVREETLAADDAYLKTTFTDFSLWEYWWEDNSIDGGCTAASCDWQFTDAPTTHEWRKIEAGQ
jgi:hypothetical protein